MDSDRIIGVAQQMRGSVEAEAGRLIGDTKLQVEGRAEQAAGTLRNTAGSIRDADHEVADDPQAEVERLRAEVERISAEPATPRLDAVAQAADRYDEEFDRYLDVIRERPLTLVSIAALAGFLLGRLTGRNRYVYRI